MFSIVVGVTIASLLSRAKPLFWGQMLSFFRAEASSQKN